MYLFISEFDIDQGGLHVLPEQESGAWINETNLCKSVIYSVCVYTVCEKLIHT